MEIKDIRENEYEFIKETWNAFFQVILW
jgi:hypothetical protein